MRDSLLKAVDLAMADDWHGAHQLAQQYQDPLACWLHGVLHKIEGDEFNSRYWYAKSHLHDYHDYSDVQAECLAIAQSLRSQS